MNAHIAYDNGYVVVALITGEDGCERYRPIINFGDRQSDAKEFVYYDIDKFSTSTIIARAKAYNNADKYKRVDSCKYVKL